MFQELIETTLYTLTDHIDSSTCDKHAFKILRCFFIPLPKALSAWMDFNLFVSLHFSMELLQLFVPHSQGKGE